MGPREVIEVDVQPVISQAAEFRHEVPVAITTVSPVCSFPTTVIFVGHHRSWTTSPPQNLQNAIARPIAFEDAGYGECCPWPRRLLPNPRATDTLSPFNRTSPLQGRHLPRASLIFFTHSPINFLLIHVVLHLRRLLEGAWDGAASSSIMGHGPRVIVHHPPPWKHLRQTSDRLHLHANLAA
ncbi:hypothetical protein LR48_Vigan04g112900 [Vigna angularis]|uniref:Uncharacterized protein n=1 Tax=Phaseolus angularis TaxID=3914 RepID=A0A0L9UDY8_PHAAN|nr:hypothetical protein LR48_Vigan04g112900 [Vigna angularis]